MFAQALSRSMALFKNSPAMILETNDVNWSNLGASISAAAGGLTAAGVKKGDRVAVLADNSPEHVIAMYAIAWAGCVLVPLNTRLSVQEMSHIVQDVSATALFSDGKNSKAAQSVLTGRDLPLISVAMDEHAVGDISFARLINGPKIEAEINAMSDLAAIYFTGGTTGAPKGVMLHHGALLLQGMSIGEELGIEQDSVVIQAPPLYHLAGSGVAHACAMSGATQIFMPEFNPEILIETVRQHRATHVSVVPTMLTVILELDGVAEAFQSVKRVFYGSSSITETLLKKLIETCPDIELTQIYGQTECAGPCLFLPPQDHKAQPQRTSKLATAGRPSKFSEVRIVDTNGDQVAPGQPGEITLRSPTVMMGYWQNPTATAAALKNDALHTGDVGVADQDGYVQIVDRLKDMIVTGGENVFCAEVENVIAEHPGVRYCSVIGLPDEKWGERVHAVVGIIDGSDLSANTIIDHCRAKIAGYKCPKSVEFTTEPLPLSAVGKVRKDVLKSRHIAALGDPK